MSLLLKRRQLVLEDTLAFLNSLAVEIEFSKKNIIKIIDDIYDGKSVGSLDFLKICRDKIASGADFPSAWQKAIYLSHIYKSEEKAKLLQLGWFLGTSDSENQVKTIRIYSAFFEKYYLSATEDYEKYGKVSSLFGLFTGAAVFLLLF